MSHSSFLYLLPARLLLPLLLLTLGYFTWPTLTDVSEKSAGNQTISHDDIFSHNEAPDFEYLARMEMFVEEHPELAELAEQVRSGDLAAKSQFEKKSLAIKFNNTKASLPSDTLDFHVVLHFLDSYIQERSGPEVGSSQTMMRLLPLMDSSPSIRASLVELGRSLSGAECDSQCIRDSMTDIMTSVISMFMMESGALGADLLPNSDDDDDDYDYDDDDDDDHSDATDHVFGTTTEGPASEVRGLGPTNDQSNGLNGESNEATGVMPDEL